MKKLFILALLVLGFYGVQAQEHQPGTPDETFGNGGFSVNDISGCGKGDQVYDLMTLSNGKILAAGPAKQNSGDQYFSVVRYNEDGSLDATFGNNGIVSFNPTGLYGNFPEEIAETPDGAYLIGGYIYDANADLTNYILVKLNIDGSFDENFGDNGVVIGPNDTPRFQISAMKVDGEGYIYGAGYVNDPDKAAVMKFNPDGSVDTSFGNNGLAVYEDGGTCFAESVCLQEDGKIVISGMFINETYGNNSAYMVRFNADGSVDNAFGRNGMVEIHVGEDYGHSFATAVTLDNEGKIVAGGHFWIANEPTLQYDLFVARYNEDGSLETSFGQNGLAIGRPLQGGANYVSDIIVSADSTIFVTGRVCLYYTNFDFAVTSFEKDGSLNSDFGNNGVYTFHDASGMETDAVSIDIAYDNKIVIGGSYSNASYFYDFMLFRMYSGIQNLEGIADIDQANFSVYPNPTANFVSISLTDSETYTAEVVDMNGRVVMMTKVSNGSRLDISKLNAGNYFLVLTDGAQKKVARIAKQ